MHTVAALKDCVKVHSIFGRDHKKSLGTMRAEVCIGKWSRRHEEANLRSSRRWLVVEHRFDANGPMHTVAALKDCVKVHSIFGRDHKKSLGTMRAEVCIGKWSRHHEEANMRSSRRWLSTGLSHANGPMHTVVAST